MNIVYYIKKQVAKVTTPLANKVGLGVSLLLVLILCSCSETKNLAEGETLYVGIKEVAYDRMPKQKSEKSDSTGVITAIGNAYNTVSEYLGGEKRDNSDESNGNSGENTEIS